jgi:hypothetical protein
MSVKKTSHSGPRKRKSRRPLPKAKTGAVYVRGARSTGNTMTAQREGVRYTRRANRKARQAGFSDAVAYAAHLVRLYEYAKRRYG